LRERGNHENSQTKAVPMMKKYEGENGGLEANPPQVSAAILAS
jgi:hypothetical protein